MKKISFHLFFALASLIFNSCEIIILEKPKEDEYVRILNIKPIYETPAEIASKVSVDPPKESTEAGKIITYGNYIFINNPYDGVHIVDNSNPQSPQYKSYLTIPGSVDLSIIDNHLYTDMYSALVTFNITDILNPEFKADFTVNDVFYYDPYRTLPSLYTIEEEYDYVNYEWVNYEKGIVTGWTTEITEEPIEDWNYPIGPYYYDLESAVQDSGNVDFNLTSTAGSMTRFLPVDRFLYTINFNEIIVFSVGDNHRPSPFAKFDTQVQAETLFKLNQTLFVGSTTGMLMYDVSSPSNPTYLNQINHFRSCDPVVADQTHAFVTLRGGTNCFTELNELQVYNIENPENLTLTDSHILYNPHGLAIYGNHLIVCDGTAGIKVVDVTDRSNIGVVANDNIPFAYDVIIDFPNAFVVGKGILYQYDISNLPALVKTAELPL